jgi:glutathione S-transferase
MPNITVYGTAAGTSFRVHWMLHEIGLPYETKSVDFAKGEHKSPEFLKLNPMGQIPVIHVDDFVLPESVAITFYLATKFAPEMLGKAPEDAAQVIRWSIWNMLHLNSSFGDLASVKWTGKELAPEVKEKVMDNLSKRLPVLEGQLAGKDYILGAFSLADVNVLATFLYGQMVNFDFSSYPNISAWLARCAARPAFVATKG